MPITYAECPPHPDPTDKQRANDQEARPPSPVIGPLTCTSWWRGQDLNLRPLGYEPSGTLQHRPTPRPFVRHCLAANGPANRAERHTRAEPQADAKVWTCASIGTCHSRGPMSTPTPKILH